MNIKKAKEVLGTNNRTRLSHNLLDYIDDLEIYVSLREKSFVNKDIPLLHQYSELVEALVVLAKHEAKILMNIV